MEFSSILYLKAIVDSEWHYYLLVHFLIALIVILAILVSSRIMKHYTTVGLAHWPSEPRLTVPNLARRNLYLVHLVPGMGTASHPHNRGK